MRVRHAGRAGRAVQQAREQRPVLVAYPASARDLVPAERLLDLLPHLGVDDGVVLAVLERVLVAHLSGVEDIRQEPVERVLGEGLAAKVAALLGCPALGGPPPAVEFLDDRDGAPESQIARTWAASSGLTTNRACFGSTS